MKTHTVFISGSDDNTEEEYKTIKKLWMDEGHYVYIPTHVWSTRGRLDLIKQSTALVVLPNWTNRRITKFEAHLATIIGIPIYRSSDPTMKWPIKGVTFEVR